MIVSEGGLESFSKKIGISVKTLQNASYKGSCNDKLVEALTKYYGVDYSWLQREDMRGRRNAHKA